MAEVEQIINVLGYVLSGDNAKIQEATKFLKPYTKKEECVSTLSVVLGSHQSPQLRQLAAVLLRRNMVKLFSQLTADVQQQLKSLLLTRFFSEEVNIIRTNIGQIIGVIAQQVLSQNTWPELYQALQTQTQKTADLVTRQRGLLLLSLIFDYSGDSLKPFYSAFFSFFVENLQDTDKVIRVQTVKCLISLFDNIEHMEKAEAQSYKTLVEPILGFVDQCIKEGDEDNAYHCFDAFSYLADARLTILDKHLGMIIQYAAGPNILLNPKCSHKFKECVIDFIYAVVENHRKVIQTNQPLLKQLVEAVSLLIAQPVNTNDYAEDEDPIQDVALWLVEIICVSLRKKKPLYSLFLETITQLVNSGDANQMNAGFLILAGTAEGLQTQLRRNLQNPIMNVLIPKGLEDPRPAVRGATIKALSYFSEWLEPEILSYDKIIIPNMVKNLSDPDPLLREKCLLTIDIFAENMDEKITEYLPTLVPSLVSVFLDGATNFRSKRLCLSSIGSIVSSAGTGFASFLAQTSQLMLKILEEKDSPEIMGVKADAISCLGKIAQAFPDNQEVQTQLITPLAERVYQLLTIHNDFEIREACLSFFYNQAAAQKEAFTPVFQQIINFTLQLAHSKEGITYEKKKEEGGEFSLDTDSDDDDECGGNRDVRVKLTQMDEKAAAIHALGQFAVSVPVAFGPYFPQVSEILSETISFFYENVRIQTITAYGHLIEGLVKFQNNGTIPPFTNGLPCLQQFNPEATQLIKTNFMQNLLNVLLNEESTEGVVQSLDAIQHLMKTLGPAVIVNNLPDLTNAIEKLLRKQALCFGVDDDEIAVEEQEEDDEDTNENVFEALTDIIPQMAKTLKLGFLTEFSKLFPAMLTYLNEEHDINDIIQMVGCFAQLYQYEPQTITYSKVQVIPFLLNAPTIKDLELNRNAAYCLANYVEYGDPAEVQQAIPQILLTLKAVFDDSAPYQAAIDNASAAICRIMVKFPQTLPLEQALATVLKYLPFTGDEEEEFTALNALLHLGNTQPQLINPHMELVVKLLIDGLHQKDKYKIKDEKLFTLTSALKSLAANPQFKTLIETTVLQIPSETERATIIAQLS